MNLLIDSQSAAISHSALSGSAVNVRKVYGRVGPYTFRGCRTNALNECTLNTDFTGLVVQRERLYDCLRCSLEFVARASPESTVPTPSAHVQVTSICNIPATGSLSAPTAAEAKPEEGQGLSNAPSAVDGGASPGHSGMTDSGSLSKPTSVSYSCAISKTNLHTESRISHPSCTSPPSWYVFLRRASALKTNTNSRNYHPRHKPMDDAAQTVLEIRAKP
eukprot:1191526-Prorocentrum_minimum.AAC.3